jgi:hypothetical protein
MRKMIQRLPSFLRPAAVPSSHLIAIDSSGVVLMDLQDPNADFPAITGAIETRQFIYVSSLFSHGFARIAKNKLN